MNTGTPISVLVRDQLPAFVRDEYDTFVRFVEAYYEYLEQQNKALDFSKHLLEYNDVERTLSEFLEYFTRMYLPLIPKDSYTAKELLIQHAKEFYRAKGTPAAFKFLFRALFGEEIDLYYGKDLILRASDGKWVTSRSLQFQKEFYSLTEGDGVTTEFRLFEICTNDTLTVYINDVAQTSGYTLGLNDPVIRFAIAPADGDQLRFAYSSMGIVYRINLDPLVLEFTGQTSGASALSEESLVKSDAYGTYIEIFISHVSPIPFLQSERVRTRYYYSETEYLTLEFVLASNVDTITLTNPGASYNIGDVVPIVGGSPDVPAVAVIDDIYLATISRIQVVTGGTGYSSGTGVSVDPPPVGPFLAFVSTVDDSGTTPNTITLNTDVISLYANVVLSDTNYGFPAFGDDNLTSILSETLTFETLRGLGSVTGVQVVTVTDEYPLGAPNVICNSSAYYFTSESDWGNVASVIQLVDLGIIASVNIDSGGSGYVVGDEIIFTTPYNNYGVGAAAEVTQIHVANNGIREIQMRPSRLSGTANTTQGIRLTIGTNTLFTQELVEGDYIEINGETRRVTTILDDLQLRVDTTWGQTLTNRHIGVYGRWPIGGQRYSKTSPPLIHAESSNPFASGANLSLGLFYGEGCQLKSFVDHQSGEIKSLVLTNHGVNYQSTPTVDLTGLGNHLATAVVSLLQSSRTYAGKFKTTDGLLSSDRKLQSKDYYNTFAYTIFTPTDLIKYKDILLRLLHPSGMQSYSETVVEPFTVDTGPYYYDVGA